MNPDVVPPHAVAGVGAPAQRRSRLQGLVVLGCRPRATRFGGRSDTRQPSAVRLAVHVLGGSLPRPPTRQSPGSDAPTAGQPRCGLRAPVGAARRGAGSRTGQMLRRPPPPAPGRATTQAPRAAPGPRQAPLRGRAPGDRSPHLPEKHPHPTRRASQRGDSHRSPSSEPARSRIRSCPTPCAGARPMCAAPSHRRRRSRPKGRRSADRQIRPGWRGAAETRATPPVAVPRPTMACRHRWPQPAPGSRTSPFDWRPRRPQKPIPATWC